MRIGCACGRFPHLTSNGVPPTGAPYHFKLPSPPKRAYFHLGSYTAPMNFNELLISQRMLQGGKLRGDANKRKKKKTTWPKTKQIPSCQAMRKVSRQLESFHVLFIMPCPASLDGFFYSIICVARRRFCRARARNQKMYALVGVHARECVLLVFNRQLTHDTGHTARRERRGAIEVERNKC